MMPIIVLRHMYSPLLMGLPERMLLNSSWCSTSYMLGEAPRYFHGDSPVIAGDGSQSFDFVHVADVASANVKAMASNVSGEAFNVGSGGEASVREITERLIALTGSDVEPTYDTGQRVLMTRRVGSNDKLVRTLGWSRSYDLDEGLRDVIEHTRAKVSAR